MFPLNTRITLSALTLMGALGLAGCAAGNSTAASEESSSVSSATTSSATASPSKSGSTESTASPTAEPTSSPSNKDLLAPVPKESANGSNISVFKAEITEASVGKTPVNQMHEVPGEQAVQATVKLENLSDSPVDATYLGFPTLKLNGTPVQGVTSEAEKSFTTIEPGQSQEVTFFFPAPTVPKQAEVKLDDGHGTSTTITHPVN